MLFSLALIFLCGWMLGEICTKLKMPTLIGMLLTGIVLGPHVLNLLDDTVLSISADIRQIALMIILTRAGLNLKLADLKKAGRPAFLLCFIPACFEIAGMVIFAPMLLGMEVIDALILGSVIAAVSPAVIVPKMLKLMDERYGINKGIPQMILTGASVDDIFVIALFTSFIDLKTQGNFSALSLLSVPVSILSGVGGGILIGWSLSKLYQIAKINNSLKVMILLSVSFLLVTAEKSLLLPFSGLIAVMSMAATLSKLKEAIAVELSVTYSKLWIFGEILLFVLVGASVDINYAMNLGMKAILLIFGALLFRMVGVGICVFKTKLSFKEKLFCMIAYMPKATVQAAIGGIPLSMGLSCGADVLSVAVMSILITAPLGAFMIEHTYTNLLEKTPSEMLDMKKSIGMNHDKLL